MERYFRVDNCVYDRENPDKRAWFGNGAEDAEKALVQIRKGNGGSYNWSGKGVGPLWWDSPDAEFAAAITYWRNYYG